MDIKEFETWLRESKGMALSTIVNYQAHIKRAISRIGKTNPTQDELDHYAIQLPSNQRGAFRAAWRHLADFAEAKGVVIANVSRGRAGRPSDFIGERLEDFAIEYLSRVIPSDRLVDLRWWCDVDLISPSDAVIYDPVDRCKYLVHRRPLDILLAWGHPNGPPYGAILPAEPHSSKFMNSGEVEERAEMARKVEAPSNPVAAFVRRSLPAPRRVAWDREAEPRRSSRSLDPRAWKP